MRHRKAGRKLNRSWEHRKAMFRNMARSLVVHESIRTTEARAKEMRKVADNLVTLAVKGDLHAKRQAYKVLNDHALVKRLFDEIGPRFAGVSGGYTRVVKLGHPRAGDAAPMAVIEFSIRAGEQAETKDKPKKAAKKAAPKAEKKDKKAETKAEEAPAEEPKVEEAPAEEAKAEEAPTEEAPAAKTEDKPEDKPEEKA
jgi:large subunit ribosomal protein L17